VENYLKGGITGAKLGVIGLEVVTSVIEGEVSHLIGAASALKVNALGLHLVGTSVALVSNVAWSMAISGGLSLFGVFMLSKTVAREVHHLRLLAEQRDTLTYVKAHGNAFVLREARDAIEVWTSERLFCREYNLPGCAATPGSATDGCWRYLRPRSGSQFRPPDEDTTYDVCE